MSSIRTTDRARGFSGVVKWDSFGNVGVAFGLHDDFRFLFVVKSDEGSTDRFTRIRASKVQIVETIVSLFFSLSCRTRFSFRDRILKFLLDILLMIELYLKALFFFSPSDVVHSNIICFIPYVFCTFIY